MKKVTCLNCGWVHFTCSSFELITQASEIEPRYTKCFKCGGSHKNFRDSKDGDCPIGSTIQAILDRNHDENK